MSPSDIMSFGIHWHVWDSLAMAQKILGAKSQDYRPQFIIIDFRYEIINVALNVISSQRGDIRYVSWHWGQNLYIPTLFSIIELISIANVKLHKLNVSKCSPQEWPKYTEIEDYTLEGRGHLIL
jgi:hypothetical protein